MLHTHSTQCQSAARKSNFNFGVNFTHSSYTLPHSARTHNLMPHPHWPTRQPVCVRQQRCYQPSSHPALLSSGQKHITVLPVSEQLPVKGVAQHKIAALRRPIMHIATLAWGGARIWVKISVLIESNLVFHMPLVTFHCFLLCFHFRLILWNWDASLAINVSCFLWLSCSFITLLY